MSSDGRPWVLPVPDYVPKPDEHVKRVVRELPCGHVSWVRAFRATHDFFGWSDQFQTQVQHSAKKHPMGLVQFTAKDSNRKGDGVGMMIWRVRDRHRPGPQGRHRFRVSRNFTLRDTAELAHFTKGDWHYMTSPTGEIRSREEWEALYAVIPEEARGVG